MIKFIAVLFEKFGLDAVQLGVIIFVSYKFLTNHWQHFTDKVDKIDKGVTANTKAINRLSNRVSKIEGKIEVKE